MTSLANTSPAVAPAGEAAPDLDALRKLYESGAPFAAMAKAWGCHPTTARSRAAALWGPRRKRPASSKRSKAAGRKGRKGGKGRKPPARSKAATAAEGDAQDVDTRDLARRVEASVRSELRAVEKRLAAASSAGAERNARTLASLVKSLAELRKLERDEGERKKDNRDSGDDDATPPVDMARLRQKLEDNLARMRADRDAAIAEGRDGV